MKKNNFLFIFPLHSVNKKLCSLQALKSSFPLNECKLNAMNNFIAGMSFQEIISRLCGENLSPQSFLSIPPIMLYTYIKERLIIAKQRKKEMDVLRPKK